MMATLSLRVDFAGVCLFIWRLICRQNGAMSTATAVCVQSLLAIESRMYRMRSGSAV